MEKKDSIFSSLAPAPSAAPAPAAKSSVSDQEVYALKQKIEALERSLASQEKKIAEARNAPPPPAPPRPPDMNAQFLLSRIGELDKKLEEFTRNALLSSSAQMKNVEESKISARREIEDLLKVVREQQKYSEMDRQMHDQLEKSWRRVEDLEKKLMDFYASAMNKSAEDSRTAQPPLLAESVEKIIDAKFQKFLTEMDQRFTAIMETLLRKSEEKTSTEADQRFKAIAEKLEAQYPALIRKSEEAVSAVSSSLDSRLTVFEKEFRKLYLTISASEDSLNSLYSGIKTEMLSVLKESVKDEKTAITNHVDSFMLDIEERMDSMSKLLLSHTDQLIVRSSEAESQLKKMETDAGINAQKVRSDLSAFEGRIEEAFRKISAETGERIRVETDRNAERIMEFSRLSAYSLTGAASLSAGMDTLVSRLAKLKDGIQTFVDGFKAVKLEAILGVSGALARKNFDGLQVSLKEMEKELAFFDAQKTEITENLKTMAEKSKGIKDGR